MAAADQARSIVRSRIDGRTVLLGSAMYGLWLGNFALHALRPLPLALHVLLAAVAIHLSFTVWHEAAHGTVSRRRWLNAAVGVIGIFPYMTPFFFQKYVHLQHHARLNQAGDPNLLYAEGAFWTLPLRYPRALRFAREALRQDPRRRWEKRIDLVSLAAVAAVWLVGAWQGWLGTLLWLWLVPLVIAKLVMDWYINWLPHVGLPADRFAGTRVVDVPWLTPLVLGHNYHAIHHLWPRIPWYRYPSTFREKRSYLEDHGAPIEHRVPGLGRPPVVRPDALAG